MNTEHPTRTARKKSKIGFLILLASLAAIVLLVVICGLASYATSQFSWDGGFPGGEYRLRVRDGSGQPIAGAVLNVYSQGGGVPSYGYPFDNYTSADSLASDAGGEIPLLHIGRGIEFGGGGWYLFWIFPMGGSMDAPEYRIEITAAGYKTFTLPGSGIFEAAYSAVQPVPTRVVEFEGESFSVPVYEISIVMNGK